MSDGNAGVNIYQYTTGGQLLQTVQTNERVLGGEMVATPEPGVFAGLGLCALAAAATATIPLVLEPTAHAVNLVGGMRFGF